MKIILDSLLGETKKSQTWKVDNFEDVNLRIKTENNDKKKRQKL